MAKKTKELPPTKGLVRQLFRFPIWIYRLWLCGLLGRALLAAQSYQAHERAGAGKLLTFSRLPAPGAEY